MDNPAVTDAIIADMIINSLSANAKVSPAIMPVSDTNASCMPNTIAPDVLNFRSMTAIIAVCVMFSQQE